jgi:hypothetical protein
MRGQMSILIMLVAAISCTSSCGYSKPPLQNMNLETAMKAPSSSPAVEIKFVEKRLERPPTASLLFDITLRNQDSRSRWFLLPSKINLLSKPVNGGVFAVEVFLLNGQGRVVIGRFLGTSGFQSLLLPPGAELKLRRVPIQLRGELTSESVPIEVKIGTNLTIGGEAAEDWFGMNPISDVRADVIEDQSQRVGGKQTTDLKALSVSIVEDSRIEIIVNTSSQQ